ncbi:MAG: hypothetical protein ACR2HS_00200, partial [Gammaproteobacteria bacterium]
MIKYTSFNLITLIAGLLINCNVQAADLPTSPDNLTNKTDNNTPISANPTINSIPNNNLPNNKLPEHVTTIPNVQNAANMPNVNNVQNLPNNLTTNQITDIPTIPDSNNNSNSNITINAENEPNTYQDNNMTNTNNVTPTETIPTELDKLHNPHIIPNIPKSKNLPNTTTTNTTTKSI